MIRSKESAFTELLLVCNFVPLQVAFHFSGVMNSTAAHYSQHAREYLPVFSKSLGRLRSPDLSPSYYFPCGHLGLLYETGVYTKPALHHIFAAAEHMQNHPETTAKLSGHY
jgi:hypothetical protein